jgi:RimJ/RimL family protein N-acetyltransferase
MDITLRTVRLEDAADLLEWKNDPDTRRFSIVTEEPIEWLAHLKWLDKRIRQLGFFVIVAGQVKCGDVRFDIGKDEIEVSIRIGRPFRNRGIATAVIGLACPLMQHCHALPLIAKVVQGNNASLRLFTKFDFRVVEHQIFMGKKFAILKRRLGI